MLKSPSAERRGTARFIHQADHRAQNDQEYEDADIVAVRQDRNDAAAEYATPGDFMGWTAGTVLFCMDYLTE